MKKIVETLIEKNKTISIMESCTGGYLANEITNVEGTSGIFSFGAVTYSNDYKIKLGVSKDIIEKYSVYSIETANEMSKAIANFTNSNYGIGITGKLKKTDELNPYGKNDKVFISIFDKDNNKFYEYSLIVKKNKRSENKKQVIDFLKEKLLKIIL